MNLLLRDATIIDPSSPHNGNQLDLLIKEGLIKSIGKNLSVEGVEVIANKGMMVSPGWMDIGVQPGDPGFEHREDLHSLNAAAGAGGFTAIACQPNTKPVVHSKSEVLYLTQNTKDSLVDFYPIGAVSQHCEGKEMTEMIDMYKAGAVAFSDGDHSIQHSGIMLRALQYVKTFGGVIINRPHDEHLAKNGQIHESLLSASLGMRGIPELAETLMLQRDISLNEYADSRLHVANISTAAAVQMVRKAKTKGINITASVPVINLAFENEVMASFDSYFKVMPPLRSKKDRAALKEGLADGTIDLISSNHVPLELEAKNLEFPYAEFGSIGLETAFALANTHLKNILSPTQLIQILAFNPRQLFGLKQSSIIEGEQANLSLFHPDEKWTVEKTQLYSKSKNTPLLGQELQGRVLGVINNHQSVIFKRT